MQGRAHRDVHVVSLDGREGYRITDHPGDDFAPIWSPDSRHLAFKSNRLGSVALWTVEIKDGKRVRQPVKVKDGMQSARLIDWTERGIFSNQFTIARDLYTVPMDPIEDTQPELSAKWSPDGRTMVLGRESRGHEAFVIEHPLAAVRPTTAPVDNATRTFP
jgi:Tol biopolymer transport system component